MSLRTNHAQLLRVAVSSILFGLCIAPVVADDSCELTWDPGPGQPGTNGWVYTMVVSESVRPGLVVGGLFTQAGGEPAVGVAHWDGENWSAFGAGLGNGVNERILALAEFDDGTGPALYAGGNFTTSGGEPVPFIARWNDSSEKWEAVGPPMNEAVIAMLPFDDGNGPVLYVGGVFTTIGDTTVNRIARWNGTEWSTFGNGANNIVRAFHVVEEQDGPALYIGGLFSAINGVATNRVARWDGQSLTPLGEGLSGVGVRAITSANGPNGAIVYAGGVFDSAAGIPSANIAAWDVNAQTWVGLGAGVNERVVNVHTFHNGITEKVYIGGWFTVADGQEIAYLGAWDGQQWSAVGGGMNTVVRAFAQMNDSLTGAPTLFVGGGFTMGNGLQLDHIARLVGCESASPTDPADLNGDGVVDVFDLLLLLGAWGDCRESAECAADLNGDGTVDVIDLLILLGSWG